MPVNGMNVGVDYSIMFYDGTSGQLVTINDIQDVQITALNHQLKNSPYNTVPIHGYVPDGYRVEFSIVRTGSVLEDYMVAFSKNFNNGDRAVRVDDGLVEVARVLHHISVALGQDWGNGGCSG